MGIDTVRIERSKRRANKYIKIAKQIAICKMYGVTVSIPNKFGKVKALNCGDPNCVMCGNPRKFWNQKTIQEKRFEQSIKNSIEQSIGD